MDHDDVSLKDASEPEDGEVEFEDGEISDDSSDAEAFALAIVRPAFRPRTSKSSGNLRGSSTSNTARTDARKLPAPLRINGIDAYSSPLRDAPPGYPQSAPPGIFHSRPPSVFDHSENVS